MINSHIIPAFYLEQFATPSLRGKDKPGRIWVYEKDKEPDERATSVQGRERGYFGFVNSDGTLEESFERVLAEHEDDCNEVLACAKSALFHWPPGSREKLAFYAALLYRRTTQARAFAGSNWSSMLQELQQSALDNELINELAACLEKRLKMPVSPDTMQGIILQWIETAQTPAAAKNSFLSDVLQMAEYIASLLLRKRPWRVLRSPEETEFVTSDNPLITFVPLGNGLLHPGYGFGKTAVVAAFPLSPRACLVMGDAWPVPITVDKATVDSFNQTLISLSDRYIYSKTRSEEIRETVQTHAGTCRYGVNALMPIGLNMPSARQFLRMRFCGDFETLNGT